MKTVKYLIGRNIKLFFKDKGMFFTAMMTPLILLVLYITFLGNVYRSSFASAIPETMNVPKELINGCVGGQLFSSLLAVCCVSVAFCSNLLMVQDKVSGARRDIDVTPVRSSTVALGYYLATLISTLLICFTATAACFIYIANIGWYLSASDIGFLLLDIFLLVMFGTALSSVINLFLSSQGQITAVSAIVSSVYGFICGAYMPISQFGDGLQKVISFLPGTYGTSLLRNHALRGVYEEMGKIGFPVQVIDEIKKSIDCKIYFFDNEVSISSMYAVLACFVILLMAAYVGIARLHARRPNRTTAGR